MGLKKRHFYNGREYTLDEQNCCLRLKEPFRVKLATNSLWGKLGFKKITGTVFGDVLGLGRFSSPFSAFVRLARLDMPIYDPKYVIAGQAIEPKVLDFLTLQPKVSRVERFDAQALNYDYFADVNLFGGVPDGLVQPQKILVEIKTTNEKNYDFWKKNGPPAGYKAQAELYAYLLKTTSFAIVATFLNETDYEKPELYDVKNHKVRTFPFRVNKAEVEERLAYATKWYYKHTASGVSPTYNPANEEDLIRYLRCRNAQEYQTLLDEWTKSGKVNWKLLEKC